ncbi:styrene monooxygenase/indole monooxygenase family protein [Actinoalloteichus spitiensis]|uniref:styrene monooxygenase/indole monooxygenase family protein n=1 Tax=Actinoalloteichus spitiensis TaxID=252394 RepID=UPI000474F0C4|nr:styrene monooxygenase/indole monooxygenase family protein [Actinoalloteichus spitiensis]
MRRILIVGSGQSGLQLALSLQEQDYEVTVISARTPEEIRNARVTSTQVMFDTALQHERDHGLNLWEPETPRIKRKHLSATGPDGTRIVNWHGDFSAYAQSVDQRVKMATWLEMFQDRGGNVIIHPASVSDLDGLARLYDLTVVAAGRGELVDMFDRDPTRSRFSGPQRAVAIVYTHGLAPEDPDITIIGINLIGGLGELYIMPGLTHTGPCDILYVSAIPGGPLDRFGDSPGPREQLDRTVALFQEYAPWERDRFAGVRITDERSNLTGRVNPMVRKPVGRLPSGGAVLGMADVVVVNDPIAGQGANNASKCAASYLTSIVEHGDRPFDEEFMTATFERYWEYAQHSTRWSNTLLAPPEPHVLDLLAAGNTHPAVGDRITNGFNNPADFANFLFEEDKARAYLASLGEPAA